MARLKAGERPTSLLLCNLHRTGVSVYAIGKRWYTPECPTCEDKLADGKVSKDDPSAAELGKEHANHASQKKRLAHMARIRAEGGTL